MGSMAERLLVSGKGHMVWVRQSAPGGPVAKEIEMSRKVLVPVVLLSLGFFSTTTFFGCSSDSPKGSGTGGKGGTTAATGGKGGSVGTGGSGSGGTGTGGSDTGGGGGTSATGGAGGTSATGGAGGTSATGGAGGGGGSAGNSAPGGAGGAGGTAGAAGSHTGGAPAGGTAGSAAGGAGGGASWPTTAAECKDPYPVMVSPTDFCAYYTTTCGDKYASVGYFASAADCVTKYTAYNATQKACVAYHLCVAGTPNGAMAHCPHPAGGTSDPCHVK